jgi:uncharacterized protein with gpF-like domain
VLAVDAVASAEWSNRMKDVGQRWTERFDEWAPKLAEVYAASMLKAHDTAFKNALKESGWAVEFKMTKAMRDVMNASIAEQVNLIKSIPEQYLRKVDGIVMRSYASGRDLQTMTKELQAVYPITKKRAALIARDQSNKLNAVIARTRSLELGIEEATWLHSHGGKEPRPDHVAANGTKFKIAEGCKISGEYIMPGELINCRCSMRVILPTR